MESTMKSKYLPEFTEIQLSILSKLIKTPILRFSDMKDEIYDNDLFNYHLQQLCKKDLVKKVDGGYSLTDSGVKVIAHMDVEANIQSLFRASVALVTIRKGEKGDYEILLQKRKRIPYLGDTTSVAGKVHYGESFVDTAKRKLKEETGLECEYKLVGQHRLIRYDTQGVLFEDILFHICIGFDPTGELIEETEYGINFWTTIDEAIKCEEKNKGKSKGNVDILKELKKDIGIYKDKIFFIEDRVQLKNF